MDAAGSLELGVASGAEFVLERWSKIDKSTIRSFKDDDGIVNDVALIYSVRNSFPLHYIVFKQLASHISHEGNNEQLFSQAGHVSDDNGKMDAHRLGVWTSIGVNMSVYEPPWKTILERYLLKFGKGGSVHEDDKGLLDLYGVEEEESIYMVEPYGATQSDDM